MKERYKSACRSIVLIDNYIDESVLVLLSKRKMGVSAEILTGRMPQQLLLDVQKQNIHDRFLIVDDVVYHIGASMKDLGKKLFAFSKMHMSPI